MITNPVKESPEAMSPFNVDVVLCMETSVLFCEKAREMVRFFYPALLAGMDDVGQPLGVLRVKMIAFGDYGADTAAMVESPFCELPAEESRLLEFVNGVPFNDGSGPKNALEAVALAMKSDWTTEGSKRRHMIAVVTHSEALPLGARADCPNYPAGMPKDLKEMESLWECPDPQFVSTFDARVGFLIAVAPPVYPWDYSEVGCWNRVILRERVAGPVFLDCSIEEEIAFEIASTLSLDRSSR